MPLFGGFSWDEHVPPFIFFNKIKYELWSKWGVAIWAILSSLEPLCSNVSSLEEQTFLQFLSLLFKNLRTLVSSKVNVLHDKCNYPFQIHCEISHDLGPIAPILPIIPHSYTPDGIISNNVFLILPCVGNIDNLRRY